MLLDAQFTRLQEGLFSYHFFPISGIFWIVAIPLVQKVSRRYLVILFFVMGLLADMYYTGIIGLYAFVFPVAIYFLYSARNVGNINVFTQMFSLIILLTSIHSVLFLENLLFNTEQVNFFRFVADVLGPTLILNLVLFAILIFPLNRIVNGKGRQAAE